MKEKIKNFFTKYIRKNIIKILSFLLLFVLLIYFVIPKTTHIYLSGFSETVTLSNFSGNFTFMANSLGEDSIKHIMGAIIENIEPIKVNIDGNEYEVESGALQIEMNSNHKNYIANLIQFYTDVEYTLTAFCCDIYLTEKQMNIEKCEDEILIDIKNNNKLKICGVYNIYIDNILICSKINSNNEIKIISNISKCLRCYHLKNVHCNKISNVNFNGCAVDVRTIIDQGSYKIDQKILQNEDTLQFVDVFLYSSSQHAFNIKNKNDTIYISGYAKDVFLDNENLTLYGLKWLLGNYSTFLISVATFVAGIFFEKFKKNE